MKPRPLPTIRRKVWSPRNTILSIGSWAWKRIDTSNWWMDAWKTDAWRYLHCPLIDNEFTEPGYEADGRVTRVYPREKKGRTVTLAMRDGELYWVYSNTDQEWAQWRIEWEAWEQARREGTK